MPGDASKFVQVGDDEEAYFLLLSFFFFHTRFGSRSFGELTHLQSCGILRAVGVVLASVFAVGGNLGAAGLIYIKRFATGVSIHTHCEIALYPRSSLDVMSENRGVAQNPIHMTSMESWMSTKARRRRLSSHLL